MTVRTFLVHTFENKVPTEIRARYFEVAKENSGLVVFKGDADSPATAIGMITIHNLKSITEAVDTDAPAA